MEREEDREGAPAARGTFDLDPPTVGLGNGSGDAEPQTCPPFALRARLGNSVKPVEGPLLLFTGQADPCVRDPEKRPLSIPLQGNGNLAAGRRVLHPVVHEV